MAKIRIPKQPHRMVIFWIEQFSFECRKVIGFAFTTLHDWFKIFAPLFHPIRSKTKTNRDSLARVFPHFASATCNFFVLWLVHLIICVLCDWLEWLLWFWFYDTQLKTALKVRRSSRDLSLQTDPARKNWTWSYTNFNYKGRSALFENIIYSILTRPGSKFFENAWGFHRGVTWRNELQWEVSNSIQKVDVLWVDF